MRYVCGSAVMVPIVVIWLGTRHHSSRKLPIVHCLVQVGEYAANCKVVRTCIDWHQRDVRLCGMVSIPYLKGSIVLHSQGKASTTRCIGVKRTIYRRYCMYQEDSNESMADEEISG